MEDNVYSAGLMSQSFWFIEFKKVVKLLSEGKATEEIKTMCIESNLFGAAKEYRAKRMFGYIINRTKTLDKAMTALFCESDLATQKLINLITILRIDRLFYEFVFTVYREKVIIGIPTMEDSDVKVFFKNMETQSEEIEHWNDSTKNKLKNCYLNFMTDANLLTVSDKKKCITPPILDVALEQCLQANGETPILKAITGVI
jgi:retron-type reverse transcriptase